MILPCGVQLLVNGRLLHAFSDGLARKSHLAPGAP